MENYHAPRIISQKKREENPGSYKPVFGNAEEVCIGIRVAIKNLYLAGPQNTKEGINHACTRT